MKQKTCQNQGVVLVTRTDFFTFFSLSWRPQAAAAAAGNYFGRTIISVYRYIAVVQQDSSDGVQSGTVKYHKATPPPHSLSRRHSISCKKAGIYFYFSLLLHVKSSFREKCPPINKVERQMCCSTQCHKITEDRLLTTR